MVNVIPGLVGAGVPDIQTGRWTGLGWDGGHGASRKAGLCGTRSTPICIVERWLAIDYLPKIRPQTGGIFDCSTTGADCANVTQDSTSSKIVVRTGAQACGSIYPIRRGLTVHWSQLQVHNGTRECLELEGIRIVVAQLRSPA